MSDTPPTPPAEETPEPIPARMLNEFVYCPRLFYYEHVEGVFLHNADTIEGKAQHSRLDAGKGNLPTARSEKTDPADADAGAEEISAADSAAPAAIHARSVSLASDTLGVTAKLDLVEAETAPDGTTAFLPVEYKRGAPRADEDGNSLWDADKMQLGLQILLLRENGYPCDQGIVFYRATRQRVTFTLTDEDVVWIKQQIAAARNAVNQSIPPPPDDSPKCPRCSLAPLCLPDESRLLARLAAEENPRPAQLELDILPGGPASLLHSSPDTWALIPEIRFPQIRPEQPVRRLIAPNDETRALYLNSPKFYVAQKGETLVVKSERETVDTFRLIDLHHVALFGSVQMSTSAIQACCKHDIPITYFSMGGFFYGMTRGNALPNVTTRIAQFAHAADPARALYHARLFLHGKIRNQRTFLQRNHIEAPRHALKALKWLAASALTANDPLSLLGIEGTAARVYFENFSGMLRSEKHDDPDPRFVFFFNERNRRPPRDPVNAVLSLLYSLLAKDCTIACQACGLDPFVGFLHQPRHGKPALALDLMEEFRPLVADSTALTLLNNRMLDQNSFVQAGRSVGLLPATRKVVFQAYEKRLADAITHPVFGYKVSYRRAIELQARLLAKVLTDEIEQYIPFLTR